MDVYTRAVNDPGRRRRAALLDAADDAGLTFEWVSDWDADLSWLEGGETVEDVWGCVCRDPGGEVLASLWGITDPDQEYMRDVQAELAAEAFAVTGPAW